ncbi:MAG: DUF4422 domain-containing protein [Lachnospiraceae bacterium]|nr:DUF4422 domain-containing protein [Lachnospiraceae bacterium]
MNLIIFGAQGYALGTYEALKTLYPKRKVLCFLVTEMGYNAPSIKGIPVYEIDKFADTLNSDERRDIQVLIATPENVQPEIEETLQNYGFCNYIRLTSDRWSEMMKLFHIKFGRFLPVAALPVGFNKPFIRIFMAKSHKDRPLRHSDRLPDYMFPLQVGSGNCDIRIADLYDNTGENISIKNGNYSELTGLYWIWKNKLNIIGTSEDDKNQYYGLVQYRRMFDFSDDDLMRLYDNEVDVVLPYPLPYEPDIHAHHERYLRNEDWQALLVALEELQPEYASYFPIVLGQHYLYNYNVILARKSVLREYCEWLFQILDRVEELTDAKNRSDRYIGYMAETLETLYFMKNSDKLNIVHTACKMYV